MGDPGRRVAPTQDRELGHGPCAALASGRPPERGLGRQHPLTPLLGQLAEPCRFVDRIADHGVLEPVLSAHVARYGNAGRDAYPEVGLGHVARQALGQGPGSAHGVAGRVVPGHRRAEHAQRRVALELVDQTALGLNHLDHDAEEAVEHPHDLGRGHRHGHGGRAHQVHEQRAHHALLAAETRTVAQGGPGHVLAHLAAEEVPDALALTQSLGHPVEAGLQQAHLAAVVDQHMGVQVAALDLLDPLPHRGDRIGDRLRGEQGGEQPDGQRDHGEEEHGRAHVRGVDVRLGDADHGDHQYAEQWYSGAEHPGHAEATTHAGGHVALGAARAECESGDRSQDALRREVDERARGPAAEQRGDPDQRGELEGVHDRVEREEEDGAHHPAGSDELHPVRRQPEGAPVLAIVRLTSVRNPLQGADQVAVAVPPHHESVGDEVDDHQGGVEERQVGSLVDVAEDRDQEADRVEDHDGARGAGHPAQPGEAGLDVADEAHATATAAGLRCASTVRAPPAGRTVMLRRLATSAPAPAALSSQAPSRARSTSLVSSIAKLAPRHRRLPPPKGIHV